MSHNQDVSIEELQAAKEGQIFDRKSGKVGPKKIGDLVIGLANADGGRIVVGMEDDCTPSGFRYLPNGILEIREGLTQWVLPPPKYSIWSKEFTHTDGMSDELLIIDIEQSTDVHKNAKDEVYVRNGRQNKLLNFEEREAFLYEKGKRNFEVGIAEGASIKDLDLELLESYGVKIGVKESEKILIARHLALNEDGQLKINYAGILLFARNPEQWIDRARIRILKYEGSVEETGVRLNIVKDEKITGPIIKQIEQTTSIVGSMLRDFTQLDKSSGKFITVAEYPPFAWKEAIINAIAHREYSIYGADIQVKLFENRFEVISPGNFPSLIRAYNIKDNHFSRNPKIARVLADFGYIQEMGEGVNRMYQEMQLAELPEPIFKGLQGSVCVQLFGNTERRRLRSKVDLIGKLKHSEFPNLSKDEQNVLLYALENHNRVTTRECVVVIGKTGDTALKILKKLVENYNPPFLIWCRKSAQDPRAYYEVNPNIFVHEDENTQNVQEVEIKNGNQKSLF